MIPYQFTSKASKCNAFCWMTGEPSFLNTLFENARAKVLAERVKRIGVGFYPLASPSNFTADKVGASVRRDQDRVKGERAFRG